MQLVSCHDGKLLKIDSRELAKRSGGRASFSTGLEAVDGLLAGGRLARGVIHEVMWKGNDPRPFFFAAWLARAASGGGEPASGKRAGVRKGLQRQTRMSAPPVTLNIRTGSDKNVSPTMVAPMPPEASRQLRIVWCDPRGEIYPPALVGVGISLSQIYLLRPGNAEEEIWALAECLGCRGVGVTVAQPPVLSRVTARRLQLAAERGGGVGVLIRPHGAASVHHAAATRWLVEPARGERTLQRWKIQLIHGHGGRLHQPVYLECSRDWNEMHRVRAVEQLADRSGEERAAAGEGQKRRSG